MHPGRSAVRLPMCLAAGLLPVAALNATIAASPAAEAARAVPPGEARVPVLAWQACGAGFQCATARVPLDWRHPRGPLISIAVIRHLATDPAHAMSRELGRARLLTIDGYGHTELANLSSCAARYETRYLIEGAPPPGTVCRQNATPFPAAASRR
jgi:TAP-like protein